MRWGLQSVSGALTHGAHACTPQSQGGEAPPAPRARCALSRATRRGFPVLPCLSLWSSQSLCCVVFCFTCCSAAGPEARVQSHRPAASTSAVAASAAEAPLGPSAGPGLPGVGTASALGPSPASGLGQLAPARLPRVARPGGRVLGALPGGLPRAVLRPCVRMSPAPTRGSSQHRAAGAPGGLASSLGAGLASRALSARSVLKSRA